jgi:hypothetical protein
MGSPRATPLGALLLVATLAACEPTPSSEPADAGLLDAAEDAAVDATPPEQHDAGPWGTRAANVTKLKFVRPCELGNCVADMPQFFAPPYPVLLRPRSRVGGVELRVGSGALLADGGAEFTYTDGLDPASVLARTGEPYDTAEGVRRPFATDTPVTWSFGFLPGQPALVVRTATFSGSLDATDLPTSTDPAMGGKVLGCFTTESAREVYLEVLSQNLLQLLEASGAVKDVDCGGSGGNDGYSLELAFEAAEVVEVPEPATADGG